MYSFERARGVKRRVSGSVCFSHAEKTDGSCVQGRLSHPVAIMKLSAALVVTFLLASCVASLEAKVRNTWRRSAMKYWACPKIEAAV